ncbi:hypothetical protein Ae168Ps1_3824c [Pseudonocardia sp. Ae168_Ps1]|uniref:hypothetical protein n=1 Tax=unclassified Pseudonocardia TaxID=2619320 RepID=UPI00094AFC75|nr:MULTISPECIES: hypothetical protein [unclassified Pseudonocardia]OLL75423.1 hypothetical protein Ae150APs1_3801c [Pseudonocardia sp. Ae150A_Ps1]OLL81418.1 hypothetical protein Ae168Ps1_3824c [Pseudonocardia sp. Ae168_Ps1]OLL84467.1 hypothetical protein Ae263Ps1_1522 [Pseudonocardia sp. Ae263_Ps1]OLL95513.1 hypothetical protein Ae356Ps1_5410c [Pseudonocardia sp. Ae356_Ps1]
MDGTRIRLVAIVGPLALAVLLGLAALLGPPAERAATSRDAGTVVPATARAGAVTGPAMLGLPHTTPPAGPVEQARTAAAPLPLPLPADTAGTGSP